MNRYLEIIVILGFLSSTLVSLKLAYGQSDNQTVSQATGLENQDRCI